MNLIRDRTDLGFLALFVSGSILLGPVDLGRTAFNSFIGDSQLIKNRVLDYCRENIRNISPRGEKDMEIEAQLAYRIGYNLKRGEKIDSQRVSMVDLWDLAEDLAPNYYDRFVWISFKDE